jgi:hypothetical protein
MNDKAFIEVLFSDGITCESWSHVSDELVQKIIDLLNDHVGPPDAELGRERPLAPPPGNPEYCTCPECGYPLEAVEKERQQLRKLALEAAEALQNRGESDISSRIYAAFRGRQSLEP